MSVLFLPHMVLLQDLTCASHRFPQGSLHFTITSPLHSFFRRKVSRIHSCQVKVTASLSQSSIHAMSFRSLVRSPPQCSLMGDKQDAEFGHIRALIVAGAASGQKIQRESLRLTLFHIPLGKSQRVLIVLPFLMEPSLRNATLETKVSLQQPATETPFLWLPSQTPAPPRWHCPLMSRE